MTTLTVMQSVRPVRVSTDRPVVAPTAAMTGAQLRAQGDAGVRLTRRGRLAVSVASVMLMALAGASVLTLATSADVQASSSTISYTVQPGDTLWAIAGRIAPGADRRDIVANLLRLNPAASAGLSAGQSLEVPR